MSFSSVCLLVIGLLEQAAPFAVKPSRSGGSMGFSKSQPMPTYTPDKSESSAKLIDFLLSKNAAGIGAGGGTEIGHSMDTASPVRGLFASKSFKKGDILCRIPSDCALALADPSAATSEVGSPTDGGLNFLEYYANNPQASVTWAPYLETLPRLDSNFDPTPDFFAEDEIRELEFPRLIKVVESRKKEVEELAQKSGLSSDELRFATCLVTSRAFQIPVDDGTAANLDDGVRSTVSKPKKNIYVMVPYLDLANHSSDQSNVDMHIVDPEKDEAWFTLRATRPIKKGKEIKLAYGKGVLSSVELLSEYGFVPETNRIDSYMLKKGEEDCIKSLDEWKTTLEEDMALLAEGDSLTANMRKVLEFRCALKRAYK
eukprot:CAMPEP_0113301002 /NCGR_PEP_ID=MMETSP0010_2-20120614/2403_1 /TAXON_ID=216773 ORGANISM="Corethron hystrix, Strain 308" /NCGR_SAMPLE_ID=MMETSP0010_2 /ASSEMBLY_ACC=CAM_ASM_000155 /LENGTH=370 /DNA_ID=CAMNT_0000154533 /DNA_START=87 /DNA_END=1199 /DNA_ORIENTATION=- /assembly_acc=CAM_ASM_000155